MNDDRKPSIPTDQHQPGGVKDTDDLSSIKHLPDSDLQHKKDADNRDKVVYTPAQDRNSGQR
jgi:hypothetical protein